jgi:hypothetical protein
MAMLSRWWWWRGREDAHTDPRIQNFVYLMQAEDVVAFYNKRGRRVRRSTWLNLHADPEYRRLLLSGIVTKSQGGVVVVCTNWMGIRFRGHGVPLLYQTLVVAGDQGINGIAQDYASEDDARLGHKATVKQVVNMLGDDAMEVVD